MTTRFVQLAFKKSGPERGLLKNKSMVSKEATPGGLSLVTSWNMNIVDHSPRS